MSGHSEKVKLIPLTRGFAATIDAEDFERVSNVHWHTKMSSGNPYAKRGIGKQCEQMSNFILGVPMGVIVDHKNLNTLDNRKTNLRVATMSQNVINRDKPSTNKSGFKGVCQRKGSLKYRAQIKIKGKKIHIGEFDNKIDAALAYNAAPLLHFGEFARLNEVPNV